MSADKSKFMIVMSYSHAWRHPRLLVYKEVFDCSQLGDSLSSMEKETSNIGFWSKI